MEILTNTKTDNRLWGIAVTDLTTCLGETVEVLWNLCLEKLANVESGITIVEM